MDGLVTKHRSNDVCGEDLREKSFFHALEKVEVGKKSTPVTQAAAPALTVFVIFIKWFCFTAINAPLLCVGCQRQKEYRLRIQALWGYLHTVLLSAGLLSPHSPSQLTMVQFILPA